MDKTLYKLDFAFRINPTDENLEKVKIHLTKYSLESLLELSKQGCPNLCIGTKKLVKKQTRRTICNEFKDQSKSENFGI